MGNNRLTNGKHFIGFTVLIIIKMDASLDRSLPSQSIFVPHVRRSVEQQPRASHSMAHPFLRKGRL